MLPLQSHLKCKLTPEVAPIMTSYRLKTKTKIKHLLMTTNIKNVKATISTQVCPFWSPGIKLFRGYHYHENLEETQQK